MEDKTINVHVWYDNNGTIIGIGYVPKMENTRIQVIPQTLENQFFIETEVTEGLLNDLPTTHKVDVKNSCLISNERLD